MKYLQTIIISCVGSAAVASAAPFIPAPPLLAHTSSVILQQSARNGLVERNLKPVVPTQGKKVVAVPERNAAERNQFVDKVKKWTKDRAEKNAKKPRIKTDRHRAMTVRDLDVEISLRALRDEISLRGLDHGLRESKKQADTNAYSKPPHFGPVVHVYRGLRRRGMNDLD